MKKVIIIVLILFVSLAGLFADKVYEIDTKYGKRSVVVPDGYTAEDVMLALAKNYYELDEDYKSLNESVIELTEDLDEYIEENNKLRTMYDDLILDYNALVDKLNLLSKVDKVKCYFTGNILFDFSSVISGMSIDLGVVLFEAFVIKTGMSYSVNNNFGLCLGIGYMF